MYAAAVKRLVISRFSLNSVVSFSSLYSHLTLPPYCESGMVVLEVCAVKDSDKGMVCPRERQTSDRDSWAPIKKGGTEVKVCPSSQWCNLRCHSDHSYALI